MYYPFKVIESNHRLNLLNRASSDTQRETELFQLLSRRFSQYQNLNAWSEALDCLIFPEHRFAYWLELLVDTVKEHDRANNTLNKDSANV